ncbi:MAG: glycoside hydrolase family 88 protein [Bacteroidota bacterium]
MRKKNSELQRRDFLKTVAAGSLVTAGSGLLASCAVPNPPDTPITLEARVKLAMLSMQRASWEQGVAAQAIWEAGDTELAVLMAREAVLRQTGDGRLAVVYTDNGVTDPGASGEVVFRASALKKDPALEEAWKKMAVWFLEKAPRSDDGILYHVMNAPEFWIDSMYMAPPFLCVAGYPEESIRQVRGLRKALFNGNAGLYAHRYHDVNKTFPNPASWGVGNGWALAGISRIIDDLPGHMTEEKRELEEYNRTTVGACLKYMRSDGLFHNNLDDPDTFVETNFPQMLAYTIYRGIASGWLDKSYREKAEQMRNAVLEKVDEEGYVQGVCGAPHFNAPGRATEGQAFFLLMEAARKKLLQV